MKRDFNNEYLIKLVNQIVAQTNLIYDMGFVIFLEILTKSNIIKHPSWIFQTPIFSFADSLRLCLCDWSPPHMGWESFPSNLYLHPPPVPHWDSNQIPTHHPEPFYCLQQLVSEDLVSLYYLCYDLSFFEVDEFVVDGNPDCIDA